MSTIYLASPWISRDGTRTVRGELVGNGHIVTSRWLDVPEGAAVPDRERGLHEARMDFEDIDRADTILVLTDARPIGAGHHVELGYALARGKRVIVVGPVKSVFHYLADEHFENWEIARSFFGAAA